MDPPLIIIQQLMSYYINEIMIYIFTFYINNMDK